MATDAAANIQAALPIVDRAVCAEPALSAAPGSVQRHDAPVRIVTRLAYASGFSALARAAPETLKGADRISADRFHLSLCGDLPSNLSVHCDVRSSSLSEVMAADAAEHGFADLVVLGVPRVGPLCPTPRTSCAAALPGPPPTRTYGPPRGGALAAPGRPARNVV